MKTRRERLDIFKLLKEKEKKKKKPTTKIFYLAKLEGEIKSFPD